MVILYNFPRKDRNLPALKLINRSNIYYYGAYRIRFIIKDN